ncbi:hypothetical protein [Dialister invisus]|nr:hypothetical protein [Dialister invisus]
MSLQRQPIIHIQIWDVAAMATCPCPTRPVSAFCAMISEMIRELMRIRKEVRRRNAGWTRLS